MALHGSASANLSPILFKGNNRALGVNVIIHQDESGSMINLISFYSDGSFIGSLQDALLAKKIGSDVTAYPNIYAYFDLFGRNSTNNQFRITNPNGSLLISQSFIRGEPTGTQTINRWVGSNYFNSGTSNHRVNICTDVAGTTTGGRLNFTQDNPKSEDVHGNLWSIWTSPNAISTGIPGRYGSILGSNVRKGSTTIVITNSDEQRNAPVNMINNPVDVSGGSRIINGPTGEMIFRGYRIIALSSYSSTDNYDGVLFYGATSSQPYGYVSFTSNTTYTITRSSIAPNWIPTTTRFNNTDRQLHDTLTLARETRGGLFKIFNVFNTTTDPSDYRIAFSKCLAEFIAGTV